MIQFFHSSFFKIPLFNILSTLFLLLSVHRFQFKSSQAFDCQSPRSIPFSLFISPACSSAFLILHLNSFTLPFLSTFFLPFCQSSYSTFYLNFISIIPFCLLSFPQIILFFRRFSTSSFADPLFLHAYLCAVIFGQKYNDAYVLCTKS